MAAGRSARNKGESDSAFRQIQDQLKWVDLIFEVRDARAPEASRHPNSDQLFGSKPRLVILAKEDLSDQAKVKRWLSTLSAGTGQAALALSLKLNKGRDRLISLCLELTAARRESLFKRGRLPRPMRACVVGMPNVGKSSLINWLIGRHKTQVGDRPGITRGKQWVRLHPQLELLDTPGILPPVSFSPSVALKLALLNLLPESAYDQEEVARQGIAILSQLYTGALEHYKIKSEDLSLEQIATARSCLVAGGKLDTRRAAAIFLTDLRAGRLGRITLDSPPTDLIK